VTPLSWYPTPPEAREEKGAEAELSMVSLYSSYILPRGDYDTIFSPAFIIGQRRAETVFVEKPK